MAIRDTGRIQVAPLAAVTMKGPRNKVLFSWQLLNNWCWAACVEMLVRGRDSRSKLRQCDIAQHSLQERCCTGTAEPCSGRTLPGQANAYLCDRGRNPERIKRLWDHFLGHTDTEHLGHPLGKQLLIDELDANRPVQARVFTDVWHVVMVVAYEAGTDNFLVFDPCTLGSTIKPYRKLVDCGSSCWTWKTTFWKLS